jgi:hypothetical protein
MITGTRRIVVSHTQSNDVDDVCLDFGPIVVQRMLNGREFTVAVSSGKAVSFLVYCVLSHVCLSRTTTLTFHFSTRRSNVYSTKVSYSRVPAAPNAIVCSIKPRPI